MAIVLAIKKWKHYLLGRKFIIKTDRRSMKYLLEQREVASEYRKCLVKLIRFDFSIQFKPKKENVVADALSRISHSSTLMQLTTTRGLNLEVATEELKRDPKWKAISIVDGEQYTKWTLSTMGTLAASQGENHVGKEFSSDFIDSKRVP